MTIVVVIIIPLIVFPTSFAQEQTTTEVTRPDAFTAEWQIADNEVFLAESLQQIESTTISIIKIQAIQQNPEFAFALHQATEQLTPKVIEQLPSQVNETLTIELEALLKEVKHQQERPYESSLRLSSEVVQAVRQAATPSEVIAELVEDEIIKQIAYETGIMERAFNTDTATTIQSSSSTTTTDLEASQQIIARIQEIVNTTELSTGHIQEIAATPTLIAEEIRDTILGTAIFHIQNTIEAINTDDVDDVETALAELHLAQHALGEFKDVRELATTADALREAMVEDAVFEVAQENVVAYFLGRGEEQGDKISIALEQISALQTELQGAKLPTTTEQNSSS